MLIDSHCHLDFPDFTDKIPEFIARAKDHDVTIMQTICTRISRFDEVLNIAKTHDNIFCSIGNHPNNVEEEGIVSAAEIVKLCEHPKTIGIGETGLDYYYEHSDRELQKQSFIEHIKASRETGLPIIIHTRSADNDTIDILTSEMKKGAFKGLIHCFTASAELAQKVLDLGFYISVSGIITFKNAQDLRDIIKHVPLQKLLVETDAPYLAPMPHRGKTNEPAFTKFTAEYLAELKGISYAEVAKQTTDNFYRLFSKAKSD
jgi:TatD DNase family protein